MADGSAVRAEGRRRVGMVTKATALASAALAGAFGVAFAAQAPASTSAGADSANPTANPDTGSANSETPPSDTTSMQSDVGSPDAQPAPARSVRTAPLTHSVARRVTAHPVETDPAPPVLRAPVRPPTPVTTPTTHHVPVRSGGS